MGGEHIEDSYNPENLEDQMAGVGKNRERAESALRWADSEASKRVEALLKPLYKKREELEQQLADINKEIEDYEGLKKESEEGLKKES